MSGNNPFTLFNLFMDCSAEFRKFYGIPSCPPGFLFGVSSIFDVLNECFPEGDCPERRVHCTHSKLLDVLRRKGQVRTVFGLHALHIVQEQVVFNWSMNEHIMPQFGFDELYDFRLFTAFSFSCRFLLFLRQAFLHRLLFAHLYLRNFRLLALHFQPLLLVLL